MKTTPTPFSGVAAIQTAALSTGKIAARLRDEAKGFKNEYEYGETNGGMWVRKTVWKDGSPFALFELDIEALPDFLVNLVSKFHREKYGCEPPVGDAQYWANTVTEWVKYTDETVCLDSPLVWIRCSIENGEPYSLSVPADEAPCEACDVVLGNFSKPEIWGAIQAMALREIEKNNDLFRNGEINIKYPATVKFFCSLIQAVAEWKVCFAWDFAPESEWKDFCLDWNGMAKCKDGTHAGKYETETDNCCPKWNFKKFWGDVYKALSGENFEDRGL